MLIIPIKEEIEARNSLLYTATSCGTVDNVVSEIGVMFK